MLSFQDDRRQVVLLARALTEVGDGGQQLADDPFGRAVARTAQDGLQPRQPELLASGFSHSWTPSVTSAMKSPGASRPSVPCSYPTPAIMPSGMPCASSLSRLSVARLYQRIGPCPAESTFTHALAGSRRTTAKVTNRFDSRSSASSRLRWSSTPSCPPEAMKLARAYARHDAPTSAGPMPCPVASARLMATRPPGKVCQSK